MKKLLAVILAAMVLGAVVPGCRQSLRYDERLTAVDSLMKDDPDSALSLLESMTISDLLAEGDRAYRSLLLTQARYKSYVTATSDSDINCALAYFRAHPADREKLTRAYIYKGAVMDELGHPDSAMFYYKHAEATAAPDDYFNLGYCNLRIAQLYQSHYNNDSAIVARMKTAARCFTTIHDTNYLITAIGTQGAYPKILGEDSARFYLKRAILLAKNIHSTKGLQYQSKLAGMYYYEGKFQKAKELAMDMFKNGGKQSNENQFYYYAARSYIQLHLLDSARQVMSIIPAPNNAVDSMNRFLLLADLALADHNFREYGYYSNKANKIKLNLSEASSKSKIEVTELKWDSKYQEEQMKKHFYNNVFFTSGFLLLVLFFVFLFATKIVKSIINRYQNELDTNRCDLEKMVLQYEQRITELKQMHNDHQTVMKIKDRQLLEMSSKCKKLEKKKDDIHKQISDIVRLRQSAVDELYQEIRIKSKPEQKGKKRSIISLMALIKELNEKKEVLQLKPKESFWMKLKTSVDGEYRGIASFVERKYPSLPIKDLHLFWLLCANLSPQVIKICMNYSSAITVSNYKRSFVKDKFGVDAKFEDFINLYLEGKLDDKN